MLMWFDVFWASLVSASQTNSSYSFCQGLLLPDPRAVHQLVVLRGHDRLGRKPLRQSYIRKGIWRQGIGSLVSPVSTRCPVVTCPYLCSSGSIFAALRALLLGSPSLTFLIEINMFWHDLLVFERSMSPQELKNKPCGPQGFCVSGGF